MYKDLKKIEIVIESVKINKIIKLIDTLQLPGYTLVPDVSGKGVHGVHDAQEISDVLRNGYMFVVCDEEQMDRLAKALIPILKKYEGICFISNVKQLIIE